MTGQESSRTGHCFVMSRMFVSVALVALFAISVVGCGKTSTIDRKPILGKIAGAEGRDGVVTLIPIDSTIGPAVTGSFENGEYKFSKTDGPVPGEYNVSVKLVVSDSEPAGRAKRSRGIDRRSGQGEKAGQGRLAYEEPMKTTVSVPTEGPFEINLDPK